MLESLLTSAIRAESPAAVTAIHLPPPRRRFISYADADPPEPVIIHQETVSKRELLLSCLFIIHPGAPVRGRPETASPSQERRALSPASVPKEPLIFVVVLCAYRLVYPKRPSLQKQGRSGPLLHVKGIPAVISPSCGLIESPVFG